jgi:hypothetical protein
MQTEAVSGVELNEFMLRCRGQIENYGCVIVTLASDRRAKKPALAYTVGLTERFRHPELLLFGLTRDASLVVMSTLVRVYVRPAFGVPLDTPLPPIIEGLTLIAKPADVERAKTHARIAYARCKQVKHPFRVDQLVWPDARNHFPWHSRYDRRYATIQPPLFDLQ